MKTGKELRALLGLEGGNIPLLSVTWETGQLAVREQAEFENAPWTCNK